MQTFRAINTFQACRLIPDPGQSWGRVSWDNPQQERAWHMRAEADRLDGWLSYGICATGSPLLEAGDLNAAMKRGMLDMARYLEMGVQEAIDDAFLSLIRDPGNRARLGEDLAAGRLPETIKGYAGERTLAMCRCPTPEEPVDPAEFTDAQCAAWRLRIDAEALDNHVTYAYRVNGPGVRNVTLAAISDAWERSLYDSLRYLDMLLDERIEDARLREIGEDAPVWTP